MHTWSICQSNLQILQRKLQHRPGSDTNTPNTQQHTHRTHSATGARGSLQPGFTQVIPLHQRAPWCDVSLTLLTSWRGKPLHQGSSRSVHAAQRYKQCYAAVPHTHTHVRLDPPHLPQNQTLQTHPQLPTSTSFRRTDTPECNVRARTGSTQDRCSSTTDKRPQVPFCQQESSGRQPPKPPPKKPWPTRHCSLRT